MARFGSLDVFQEVVSQSSVLMRSLDEPGDVRHGDLPPILRRDMRERGEEEGKEGEGLTVYSTMPTEGKRVVKG